MSFRKFYEVDTSNNVTIYQTNNGAMGGYYCMYYFMAKGYILDEEYSNNSGFCYYCQFFTRLGKNFSIPNEQYYHHLCNYCIDEWNIRKNDIKYIGCGYYDIDDSVNLPIKYDVVQLDSDKFTVYYRMIVPIKIYNYYFLVKFPVINEDCPMCYYNKHYNDHTNLQNDIDCVCQECLDFSLKLLVDKYYDRYLLVKGIMVDVDTIIIGFFIELLKN